MNGSPIPQESVVAEYLTNTPQQRCVADPLLPGEPQTNRTGLQLMGKGSDLSVDKNQGIASDQKHTPALWRVLSSY